LAFWKKEAFPAILAGGAAGLVNGFFGGGGGMVLVPMLMSKCGLEERKAFATSVAVIFPLCMMSSILYFLRGSLDLTAAVPYLVGGLIGGSLAGHMFHKLNMDILRKGFALFILYGGIKSLFFG